MARKSGWPITLWLMSPESLPLLALSGPNTARKRCPLLGAKQTWHHADKARYTDAFDREVWPHNLWYRLASSFLTRWTMSAIRSGFRPNRVPRSRAFLMPSICRSRRKAFSKSTINARRRSSSRLLGQSRHCWPQPSWSGLDPRADRGGFPGQLPRMHFMKVLS